MSTTSSYVLIQTENIYQIQKRLKDYLSYFETNFDNKIAILEDKAIEPLIEKNEIISKNLMMICNAYRSDIYFPIFRTFLDSDDFKREKCKQELFSNKSYWMYSWFVKYSKVIDFYMSFKILKFHIKQFNNLIDILISQMLQNNKEIKIDMTLNFNFSSIKDAMKTNYLFHETYISLNNKDSSLDFFL